MRLASEQETTDGGSIFLVSYKQIVVAARPIVFVCVYVYASRAYQNIMSRLTIWPMLLCIIGALALVGPMPANGAVANTHKHEKHLSKERVKDGNYVPRDGHHHNDLGEHNVEFDHEAIIGG